MGRYTPNQGYQISFHIRLGKHARNRTAELAIFAALVSMYTAMYCTTKEIRRGDSRCSL